MPAGILVNVILSQYFPLDYFDELHNISIITTIFNTSISIRFIVSAQKVSGLIIEHHIIEAVIIITAIIPPISSVQLFIGCVCALEDRGCLGSNL